MRYDDASQAGSTVASGPSAHPDVEALAPGSFGPASGNAISGAGTTSGQAGADQVGAAPAAIVEVHGAGGQTVQANGAFQASGQYGLLSMNADGEFNYVRNPGTPDGVQDVFNYTLADASGATSATTLTIDIRQVAAAAAGQGVVNLPAGVELSDIHVNGRDLVINMPDGTQMVIPGGAVFVPELTIGDVQVPPTNLAALLVDSEPQPAAGPPQSSGNNFPDPVPPLDPGVPLGDLIPPTELTYTPPEFHEVNQFDNTKPTIIIETPDNPAGAVNAVDSVDESGLPSRTVGGASEPAGTLASQDIESTSGTIVFTAQDGLDSVTINNVVVASVGQQIVGAHGTLTITGIDLNSGEISYSYTASDNTTDGVDDFEDFAVIVTDSDGDTATGTLHINIEDDEPIALNDTDSTDVVTHVATGNVMTGADTTSGASGADTVGADNATLTAVSSNNTGASDSSFDGSGNLVVEGEFGSLTIKADGSYVYTAHQDAPGGSSEVFTYTLTDGDGDPAQATLTITNPDHMPTAGDNAVVQLDDDALAGGNPGGVGDDPDAAHTSGTLSGSGGDGALSFVLTENGAPDGFTYSLQSNGNLWVMQGSTHVLTIAVDGATGAYTVTQVAPIDHSAGDTENNVEFGISYTVTDADGDPATGHLTVNVDDDTPVARNDTDGLDSNGHAAGNVITGAGTTSGSAGADSYGADGPGQLTGVSSNGTGQSDTSFDSSGNLVVHGSFGTLTIDANGEYTYVRDAGSTAAGSEVFTYTIVDGDGDPTTATLTIAVPNIVIDHTPIANTPAAVMVDDDDLPSGNHDNAPGDDDPANTTGFLTGSGGDGDLDFYFSATQTSLPTGFTSTLVNAGELDIYQGTTHVLTVTLNNETGAYTVTEINPVQQLSGDSENNINDINIGFFAQDADGDHSNTAFLSISVDDDIPTPVIPPVDPEHPNDPPPALVGGAVDEDDLPDGNNDVAPGDDLPIDSSTTASGAAGSLDALFSAGADQPLTFGLSIDTSGLPALTSDGHAVLYAVDGGVLTGVVDLDDSGTIDDGETNVFTLTVNEDGSWSFELQGQLDHSDPTTEDNLLLDFSSVITATDADGDPATAAGGAFVINVDDDSPQQFDGCPQETVGVNGAGTVIEDLSLNLPPVGADAPATLSFGTIKDGDPVLDNDGHQLSSDGQLLYYSVNPSDPTILEARTDPAPGEGTLVFQIDLDPDAGTYTYHQYETISAETELSITDLSSIGGGNVDAKAIDVPDSPFDLILSTSSGNTVNTSADWIGVSGGQSLSAGDVIRVDFVQNAFVTGSGSGANLNFGEYYSANAFREDVGGLNSNQFASFNVRAVTANEAPGSDPSDPADGDVDFYGDGNDAGVGVTQLNLYDTSGTLVDIAAYNASNPGGDPDIVVTDNGDGSWTVEGLPQGFDFEITSTTPFQAVEVTAVEGSDTFKLGAIDLTSVVEGSVDFTVPLTLADADGDPVSCDIDVNLGPPTGTPDVTAQVDEAALSSIGSDPASDSETTGGDLSAIVSGGSGATFALEGDADHDGILVGARGTITLNSDGTWTYTLSNPVDSTPDANDGTNVEPGVETFTYQMIEGGEVIGTGHITINVKDDVPTAIVDTNSVSEGALLDVNAASGVLANDVFGADGPTVAGGGVVGVRAAGADTTTAVTTGVNTSIVGSYGTLILQADGSYTYQANADALTSDVTDHFVYTIKDGDGDLSTITLDIDVNNVGVGVSDDDALVNEAGLSTGSNAVATSEVFNGAIVPSGGDGPYTYTLDSDGDHDGQVSGTYGNLVLNADGTYTYTLTSRYDSSPDANNSTNTEQDRDSFSYTVTDSHGNTTTGTILVDIVDDVPTAAADSNSVTEGALLDVNAASGVLANDVFGADGPTVAGGGVVGVRAAGADTTTAVTTGVNTSIAGLYGTLTLQADGSYTYQADADVLTSDVTDHFVYTIKDGDGDLSTITLDIDVDNVGVGVSDDDALVDEAGLSTGSNAVATSEVFNGAIVPSGGDGPYTYSLNADGDHDGQVSGTYGNLVLNADGTYTYTLTSRYDTSPDANNSTNTEQDRDSFTYTVTDAHGNTTTGTILVDIVDDVPTAHLDTNSVTEGALLSVNAASGVVANDVFGADGPTVANAGVVGVRVAGADTTTAVTSGVNTSIVGSYGTLTLQANGSYTYQANSNVSGTPVDHFVYTIKDGDGDLSTTTLDITVNDGAGPGAGGNVALTLNEFALDMTKDANDLAAGTSTGTNASATSETQVVLQASGLHFSAGSDDITSIAFSLDSPPSVSGLETGFTISWAINGTGQMVGNLMQGATDLGTAIIVQLTGETGASAGDTADVGVTATLVGRLEHVNPPGTQGPVTVTGIQVVASQADGDFNTGTVSLTVTDDTPTAPKPEDASVTNDASGFDTGTLDTDDSTLANNVGADGGIARFSHTGLPTLSSGGTTLVYEFSNNDQTLTAKAGAGGPTIFTATISGSGYTIDMDGTLDSLQHVNLSPLSSGFVGGNDPWAGFNLTGPGDILLTPTSDTGTLGSQSNTLNTSNILLGVGSGNAVDQHEGLRIDFVQNLGGNPAKTDPGGYSDVDNRDHTFDGHYVSNGASVKMTQESGTVIAQFRAYDDYNGTGVSDPNYSGTDGLANDVVGDGSQEAITGITITYLGVTYEDPATHVQIIVPTTTATTYTVNGHDFIVQLVGNAVNVTGIEGESGNGGAGTDIAIFTADGYTSLEVINVSTDSSASFKISNIGATVISNDPVQFDLPVQIVDNDNDVSATGNIHVTAGSASSLASTLSANTTQGFKSALAPSNDNGGQKQTGTNTTVLTAALAAAGISSAHSAASHGSDSPHFDHGDHMAEKVAGGNFASLMADRGEGHDGVDHGAEAAKEGQHEAIVSRAPVHTEQVQSQAQLGGEDHQTAQTELQQGTTGPAQGGGTQVAHIAAQGVIMPSAEQLAAASAAAPQASVAGQPQHNEVVGKVLVDALQGGDGHAPDIEELVQAAGSGGPAGPHALEALASHGMEAVPNGHMAIFAGFAGAHGGLMMDPMIVHQDAAPAHS